ncbi:MAG: polysaccharide deacetylase family protein [Deltaproteobacteria bacterium]|nr:polysaccharide deacetylase family protein [Deltaproteobacteria bacterium]
MNKVVGTAGLFLFLLFWGLILAPPFVWGNQANIFVYHRFGDDRYPSTNVSLETFEAHLKILQKENVEVLPLGEVVKRLRQRRPLPPACAVLTVDDGYRSFLSGAMPLLRRFGYPATLFVSSGAVGGPGFLSWQELHALAQEGIEIGNHSASHMHLVEKKAGETTAQWRARVKGDVAAAQADFSTHLGQEATLFSYPYGEYCPELVDLVAELGFSGAAGQQSGVVRSANQLYALPRFPMGGSFASVEGFSSKLKMKALPVQIIAPQSSLLAEENPPLLRVAIDDNEVDLRRLRCFVSGQENGRIQPDPSLPNGYLVQANAPLMSRRSKYTLTAPSKNGKSWYWFSQLWIRTDVPE